MNYLKKIVGWFQDSMEFGHRALGNRSILADPRYVDMQKAVNKAVKFRESFRPFAPAVIGEKADKIFDLKRKEKILFMERAVQVRKKWKINFKLSVTLIIQQEFRVFSKTQI